MPLLLNVAPYEQSTVAAAAVAPWSIAQTIVHREHYAGGPVVVFAHALVHVTPTYSSSSKAPRILSNRLALDMALPLVGPGPLVAAPPEGRELPAAGGAFEAACCGQQQATRMFSALTRSPLATFGEI